MNNKQTAVEYLIEHLEEMYFLNEETLYEFEQAKAMFEQQIMDAHFAPKYGCFSEQYYNETFKSE